MIEIRDEQKEIPVRDEANICANDIVSLLETALSWSDIEPLIRKRAKALLDCCAIDDGEVVVHCNNEENARIIATILDMDADGHYLTYSSIFGEEEEPAPPKDE